MTRLVYLALCFAIISLYLGASSARAVDGRLSRKQLTKDASSVYSRNKSNRKESSTTIAEVDSKPAARGQWRGVLGTSSRTNGQQREGGAGSTAQHDRLLFQPSPEGKEHSLRSLFSMNSPVGVAYGTYHDASGFFTSSFADDVIYFYSEGTGTSELVAGTINTQGSDDGPRLDCTLGNPSRMAFDATNNRLFVMELETGHVRVVDFATDQVYRVKSSNGQYVEFPLPAQMSGYFPGFDIQFGNNVLYVATTYSVYSISSGTGRLSDLPSHAVVTEYASISEYKRINGYSDQSFIYSVTLNTRRNHLYVSISCGKNVILAVPVGAVGANSHNKISVLVGDESNTFVIENGGAPSIVNGYYGYDPADVKLAFPMHLRYHAATDCVYFTEAFPVTSVPSNYYGSLSVRRVNVQTLMVDSYVGIDFSNGIEGYDTVGTTGGFADGPVEIASFTYPMSLDVSTSTDSDGFPSIIVADFSHSYVRGSYVYLIPTVEPTLVPTPSPTTVEQFFTEAPTKPEQFVTSAPTRASQLVTSAPTLSSQFHTDAPSAAGQFLTEAPTTVEQFKTEAPTTVEQFRASIRPTTVEQFHTEAPSLPSQFHTEAPTTDAQFHTEAPTTVQQFKTNAPTTVEQFRNSPSPTIEGVLTTDAPTSPSQFVTEAPTRLDQFSTPVPTTKSQFTTRIPTTTDKFVTRTPTRIEQYLEPVPTYADEVTSAPTRLSQYLTKQPTLVEQYRTDAPTSADQFVTEAPTRPEQFVTSAPTRLQQFVTSIPTTVDQFRTAVPTVPRPTRAPTTAPTSPLGPEYNAKDSNKNRDPLAVGSPLFIAVIIISGLLFLALLCFLAILLDTMRRRKIQENSADDASETEMVPLTDAIRAAFLSAAGFRSLSTSEPSGLLSQQNTNTTDGDNQVDIEDINVEITSDSTIRDMENGSGSSRGRLSNSTSGGSVRGTPNNTSTSTISNNSDALNVSTHSSMGLMDEEGVDDSSVIYSSLSRHAGTGTSAARAMDTFEFTTGYDDNASFT